MKRYILLVFVFFIVYSSQLWSQIPAGPSYYNDFPVMTLSGDGVSVKSHIFVAKNGWVYYMSLFFNSNTDVQQLVISRTKDFGITYSVICGREFNSNISGRLVDCDFVVTGQNESDMLIWIATVVNAQSGNKSAIYLDKLDSDGLFVETNYIWEFPDASDEFYSVSIATDDRSPASVSSPYSIAVASTGYLAGKDKLLYLVKSNPGSMFSIVSLYSTPVKGSLGKVSNSLGVWQEQSEGVSTIAFEMDKNSSGQGNVGLLANNYLFSNTGWSTPFDVSFLIPNQSAKPAVCSVLNSQLSVTSAGFLVTMEDYSLGSQDIGLFCITPSESFELNSQPTLSSFSYNHIGYGDGICQQSPSLGFDKLYNNYLLTFQENNSLKYLFNYFGMLGSSWTDYGNYRDRETQMNYNASPHVDINPIQQMACFSWSELELSGGSDKATVYADAEWLHTGIDLFSSDQNDIILSPCPADQTVQIRKLFDRKYVLSIYSSCGELVASVNLPPDNLELDTSSIPSGLYIAVLKSPLRTVVQKLLIVH